MSLPLASPFSAVSVHSAGPIDGTGPDDDGGALHFVRFAIVFLTLQ